MTFYTEHIKPAVDRDPDVMAAQRRLEEATRARLDAGQAYQNAVSLAIEKHLAECRAVLLEQLRR